MAKAPTSIERIFREVRAYHEKMNAVSDFLETNKASEKIKIKKDKEYIGFYIGKKALDRLNKLAAEPDCHTIAVYLGLSDEEQHCVTGCFVAINKDRKIIDGHFPDRSGKPGLPGEDTWIPPGGGAIAMHEDDDDGDLSDKDLKLSTLPTELRGHFRQP